LAGPADTALVWLAAITSVMVLVSSNLGGSGYFNLGGSAEVAFALHLGRRGISRPASLVVVFCNNSAWLAAVTEACCLVVKSFVLVLVSFWKGKRVLDSFLLSPPSGK